GLCSVRSPGCASGCSSSSPSPTVSTCSLLCSARRSSRCGSTARLQSAGAAVSLPSSQSSPGRARSCTARPTGSSSAPSWFSPSSGYACCARWHNGNRSPPSPSTTRRSHCSKSERSQQPSDDRPVQRQCAVEQTSADRQRDRRYVDRGDPPRCQRTVAHAAFRLQLPAAAPNPPEVAQHPSVTADLRGEPLLPGCQDEHC